MSFASASESATEAFLADHRSDPAWRRAIGMRHRLAHDYDVDDELVWDVVSRHAVELRRRVEGLTAGD